MSRVAETRRQLLAQIEAIQARLDELDAGDAPHEDDVAGNVAGSSECRLVEAASGGTEARFRAAFDLNPAMMMIVDVPSGTILEINKAYQRRLGRTKEGVIGVPGKFGYAVAHAAAKDDLIRSIRANDHLSEHALTLITGSGEKIDVLVFAEPMDVQDQHLHVVTFIEITERKRAQASLVASEARFRALVENSYDVINMFSADGRLLYTRWEYNDRSQLCYHHLWTVNLDGTGQMTYFGNMYPTGMPYNLASREGNGVRYNNVPGAEAMLDSKPIPGTRRVVSIFSPGHGRREHHGYMTIIDPRRGPDHQPFARRIHNDVNWRDPYPLSPTRFLVVRERELFLMDDQGATRRLFALSDPRPQMRLHEPVPIRRRPRERISAVRNDAAEASGRLVLADITRGRNMDGVASGEIKKLLVMEQLPAPFHNSPGFDGISLWGPFTIARILGTVPVEADGSAFFEAPAMRSLFFVALDENDLSVKKMQSFVTLQPGETTSCVGCHEPRTVTPRNPGQPALLATSRPASRIERIEGVPEIVDFRRHIQPILDQHCAECHGVNDPDGGICLTGHRGVPSHGLGRVLTSYVELVQRHEEIVDGRNAHGNRAPRRIGSSASKLMTRLDGSHYDVEVPPAQVQIVRLWLDSGAVANGTYAIMDGGTPEQPSGQYLREMQRYGILPPDFDPTGSSIDVYATDEAYFQSFWLPGQE